MARLLVRREGGLALPQQVVIGLAIASAIVAFMLYTALSIIVGGDTVALGFVGHNLIQSASGPAGWVLAVWAGAAVLAIFKCLNASNPARFSLFLLLGGVALVTLILGAQSALVDNVGLTSLLRFAIALLAAGAALAPIWFLTRRSSSRWFNL